MTNAWGGAGWLIVPTDGQDVEQSWRTLIRRYDPDYILDFEGSSSISDDLQERLRSEFPTLQSDDDFVETIWPDVAGWPLSSVAEVLPDSGLPWQVESWEVVGDPVSRAAVLAATGTLTKDASKNLGQATFVNKELDLTESMAAGLTSEPWYRGRRETGTRPPLHLSLLHTECYATGFPRRAGLLVVVGDTFNDFCLWWNLRSLRGLIRESPVFWSPFTGAEHGYAKSFVESKIALALRSNLRSGFVERTVAVTSHSIDALDLGQIESRLQSTPDFRASTDKQPKWEIVPSNDFDRLAPYDANLWELNNSPNENGSIVQFLDGIGLTLLSTPTPRDVKVSGVTNMRWIVDVRIDGVQLPVRRGLSQLAFHETGNLRTRVSRGGLSFEPIGMLVGNYMSAESMVVHPRISIPSPWDILGRIAQDAGLSVSTSDAGDYENEWLAKAGDLRKIVAALRDPGRAKILLALANKDYHGDLGYASGNFRHMSLQNLTAIAANEATAEDFVDSMLQDDLLSRGIWIKCPYCRKSDWYPMRTLSDSMTCSRCDRRHTYRSRDSIYFRLDALVNEALRKDSHVTMLTLEALNDMFKERGQFLTACEFRKNPADEKPFAEVDFVSFVGGRFILGECKANNRIGRTLKKQLGERLELCDLVRPSHFVLSTIGKAWAEAAEGFIDGFREQLAGRGIELLLLKDTDLCWSVTDK